MTNHLDLSLDYMLCTECVDVSKFAQLQWSQINLISETVKIQMIDPT